MHWAMKVTLMNIVCVNNRNKTQFSSLTWGSLDTLKSSSRSETLCLFKGSCHGCPFQQTGDGLHLKIRSVHHRKFIFNLLTKKIWTNSSLVFWVSKLSPIGVIKHKAPKEAVCTNKSPLNSHPVSRKTFVLHVNWECCSPGNLCAIKQTAGKRGRNEPLHFTGDWDILIKKCGEWDRTDWSLGENGYIRGALCEGLQPVFRCQRGQRWS